MVATRVGALGAMDGFEEGQNLKGMREDAHSRDGRRSVARGGAGRDAQLVPLAVIDGADMNKVKGGFRLAPAAAQRGSLEVKVRAGKWTLACPELGDGALGPTVGKLGGCGRGLVPRGGRGLVPLRGDVLADTGHRDRAVELDVSLP